GAVCERLPPVATTGLYKGLQVRRTRPSPVGHPHTTRRSRARAPTSTRWTLRGRRRGGPSPNQKTKHAREQEKTRSPLTDSNRRPPPYHGGWARHARTRDHLRRISSCKLKGSRRIRCVARRRACRF